LISIIVPVHNAERHLGECLASIQAQSLTDFELLLVDDGSTDSTPEILAGFVAREPRARVLAGPARGTAGAARNLGMAEAKGEYLSFLDADDYFLPSMLEELHARAVATNADVVACKFVIYDDVTREVASANWMLRTESLPSDRDVFSGREVGDHVFAAFNPAAWNKLFRADFVRRHQLRFQELRRTNDAYFTYMALALADRISFLDRHLVNYRVANSSSLQGTVHQDPLEFVQALEAMRVTLKEKRVWAWAARPFSGLALSLCVTNLKRQTEPSAFLQVYDALRDRVFDQLGISGHPADYFIRRDHWEWYERVARQSATEYLFERATVAEASVVRSGQEAKAAIKVALQAEPGGRQPRPTTPTRATLEPAGDADGRPDVSVIIPVYNTLVFLEECVESARRQVGCSIEIVCVDDGSRDGSGEVLDRYASADPRIRVVHRDNGGLSRARNTGVSVATGRYVCFLDSDDYWQGDTGLAELVRKADAEELDVLLFDACCVREAGVDDQLWERYATYYVRQAYASDYDGPGLMAAMNAQKEYRASACLSLVRRSHLVASGLRFFPGIAHEDNLYTFALLLDARRAAHSQTALYARRVRPGSIITAGSRAMAARGHFISWVEMLRFLRGRRFRDAEVTRQVAGIAQSIYSAARRNASHLPEDVFGYLEAADDAADAVALYLTLRQGRGDDRAKRRLEKKLKNAPAPPRPTWVRRGRRFVRRLLDRG
jgi:glycosyltransferase involved in cell wall biosynthesis